MSDSEPDAKRRLPIALILTVLVVAAYTAVFVRLVWLRHENFGSFDYDLGMYDQGIWQLAHGRGFMTIRGMHLFAHHANVGYLLFVPAYWVGIGGPHLLNIANTLAVVSVSVPLFGLARRHLRNDWVGLGFVIAYLLHFAPQWKIQETFHPESFAAPMLVGAFYYASIGRWRRFALCVAAALIWKEDVALAVAVLGLAVGVLFRRPKVAVVTVAASVLWFVVATEVFMPAFSQTDAVYDGLFGPLGSSATDVVKTSVRHPSRMFTTLDCHGAIDGQPKVSDGPIEGVWCPDEGTVESLDNTPIGMLDLAAPYGVVPGIANPFLTAIGTPQHVVNSATTVNFTWDLRWHYAMFPFIGVLLSAVWTVVTLLRMPRRWVRMGGWLMLATMLVGVVASHDRGVGPWSEAYDMGYWPLERTRFDDALRRVLDGIGDDEVVSTAYFVVPHVTHREHIYTFPNPWRASNYGIGGVPKPPDPSTVDVVILNRRALNESEGALFDQIAASGEWVREVQTFGDGDLTVLRRRGR